MQDQELWHSKWAANQIGFHLTDVNPLLKQYWPKLGPAHEMNVLVPLCGKSEDLVWLAEKHHEVIGVELSDIAVRAFFAEHFYTPTVTPLNGQHSLYQFDELSLYAGDFFTAPIAPVDLVYDRAALIALPQELREQYVEKVLSCAKDGAKILLVTLDYQQQDMKGPPFAVPASEVEQLFSRCKSVTKLERNENIERHGKLKEASPYFAEEVWLIEI
ncbi:thiopurine S-methyltransferase [Vibrio sp. SCSIO 43136]|uniref:thiopurine S-methyltransferase n=1 Tax=Vibrio sp. SCSIO 43136 TaxID=2819101 RepID=UPI0020750E87|nr:thiopurine S-methyltransferase [Vibrio sp. SCSIO 43136]USD66506.1 thiopurine S-methyltransferase [Vibrio sp. SCSIO 43136]